jgi:hypothetical protein
MNKVYVAIDLKSFYASVECVELGLELTEDETLELNANLNRLLDSLDERPQISVTYFVPDEKKSGGKYVEKLGVVRIYDSYANELVFTDGVRIAVADMAKLDFMEK